MKWIVDEWYDYKANGTAYDGNTEIVWRGLADGGAAIAPYHALADSVPDDVKSAVDETLAGIESGSIEVPLDTSVPTSD